MMNTITGLVYFVFLVVSCGSGVESRTTSPDGTYLVILTGNGGRPSVGTNVVEFRVVKGGEEYIKPTVLHSAGPMDLPFETGYLKPEWMSENVLKFHRTGGARATPQVHVTVTNNTSVQIAFMKVNCTDKFLLLDLKVGARASFDCTPPLGDSVDFYTELRFVDDTALREGAFFPWDERMARSYEIDVLADKVKIIESN